MPASPAEILSEPRARQAAGDAPGDAAHGSGDAVLRVENLSVRFGQPVLRGVNLTVPAGQTLVVIGESGCGKTVLLKALIGLVRPDSGSVHLDGCDLASLAPAALARARTRCGFVFQNAALFDSMTVAQNLAFPLRQHTARPEAEVAEIVRRRLAEVGLPESLLHRKPVELSGGMRKRVGLARALMLEPELMLYDEPTTGLDPIMSDVINELIIRTRDLNPVTSIVVTHDMFSARKLADRIVMLYPLPRLRPGEPQILYDGPPEGLDDCDDERVLQFVHGQAGDRLMEMQAAGAIGA